MRFLLPLSVVALWLAQSNDAFQLPATSTVNRVPPMQKTAATSALFGVQSNDGDNNKKRIGKRRKVMNKLKKSLAFLAPVAIAGSSVVPLVSNPKTAHAGAPVMAMPKTKAQDPVQVAFDLQEKKLMMEAQKELTEFQAKARTIEKESGPEARAQFEKEYKDAQSRKAQERDEGLVQLKRDLLDQGIDPALDTEGKRQVILYNKGVDLGEISGTQFNVEKRYEAMGSPEAFAIRKKANREIIKAMVQDLKNRGQDPLKYFEIHQDKTDMILNLPAAKAEALSVRYNENLEKYGQISVPKEGEKSAKELMAEQGETGDGKAEAKAKAAAEKAAAKAAAKAEKLRVKEEKAAAKAAAKAEKEAAKEAAKAEKEAAKEAAAVAAAAAAAAASAAASSAASTAAAAADAIPPAATQDTSVATIEQSTEETAVSTISEEEEKSGGLNIAPAAGLVIVAGGGAYAFKSIQDRSAAAEEERQRQFRMLMGGDAVASSDTEASTEDDVLGDYEAEIDGTPEPVVEAPPPKKKKRRGLKSVFGKKSNGRETNIDNLVAPDANAADFSKTLAKILTFGAPGRFPYISSLPGDMPMESFDLEAASSILTEAQAEAGISKEESAEIFANVVNCMLIDIVDLASTSLKEKDQKITTEAIGIVITFMDLAASLYTSIAEGVDIVPVTYGGDIGKNKLEQMYSTYAMSGMTDMSSMDEKFDDRVSLLQDVFQINPKKAEGLMMKAMQKNMMEMMKSGKMPEGMEELMGGMGDMGGMGLPGMDGEDIDPEQVKEMLRSLKQLKDSGSLPEEELEQVRSEFKKAFGSSIDDIMKGANEAGEELGEQDRELLDLMKEILE